MEHDAKDLDIVLSKENFIKNLFEKLVGVATSANQVRLSPYFLFELLISYPIKMKLHITKKILP